MSLHALANHMASKGRNGDSVLVHMTPGEVHGLQALAMKHGGSLTINPNTGLPEANFLKSLLPMLAGFALGPAGFGLVSSAMGAGAIVGGITGIATGSLSKGLMAGLGAYGGFGIGESLLGAGAGTATGNAAALGVEGAATGVGSQAAMLAEQNAGFGAEGLTRLADSAKGAIGAAPSTSGMLSAGFDAVKNAPGAFLKNNLGNIAAAASPIMADMMVPTTTKAPTPTAPGRIVEKRWDGHQFVPVASTDAGVFNSSGRTFSDFNRGYNDGGIVALADGGGVMKMAEGGIAGYAIGGTTAADLEAAYAAKDYSKVNELVQANHVTEADIQNQWKGLDTSGLAGLGVNLAKPYENYSDEQIGSYLKANPNADIAAAIKTTNADPNAVNKYISNIPAPFVGSTETTGGSGTLAVYNNLLAQGIDPNELYAARIANDPKYAGWTKDMLNTGYNLDKGALALSAAQPGGVTDKDWVKFMDDNKYSVNDMAQSFGLSLKEVRDRYNAVKNAEKKVVTTGTGTGTTIIPGVNDGGLGGKGTSGSLESVYGPSLPPGVSGAGVTTVNPNGTITTRPDFSLEMRDVRNAYTKGGGSLGYTSPSFTNIDDFTKKYVTDRMSGDSLDAYNYLSGKGGAQYPVKSRVGQISRPYDEAVLGYPARGNLPYTYNKATGKMDVNPDYVAPGRDAAGNVTYTMSLNEIKNTLKDAPLSGQALYDWATTNNLSAQQIADATNQSLSSVYAQFRAGAKAAAAKKKTDAAAAASETDVGSSNQPFQGAAAGGMMGYADGGYAVGGGLGSLGSYSDGGRLLKGPGDGVSDSIPATIGQKQQPARLADGEFVVPARIVSELGNGSTDAGAKKLYAMMDRVQRARGKTTGKTKVAANSRADKYLPA